MLLRSDCSQQRDVPCRWQRYTLHTHTHAYHTHRIYDDFYTLHEQYNNESVIRCKKRAQLRLVPSLVHENNECSLVPLTFLLKLFFAPNQMIYGHGGYGYGYGGWRSIGLVPGLKLYITILRKQFNQRSVHFRNQSCSKRVIVFTLYLNNII